MKPRMQIVILALPIILQGCATATKSALLGSFVGGTVGAVIGKQQSDSRDAPFAGAAIGAGIGGLIGYLSYQSNKKDSKSTPLAPAQIEQQYPALTEPKMRSIFVPDKIEGNRYIKGHQIFILEEPTTWKQE